MCKSLWHVQIRASGLCIHSIYLHMGESICGIVCTELHLHWSPLSVWPYKVSLQTCNSAISFAKGSFCLKNKGRVTLWRNHDIILGNKLFWGVLFSCLPFNGVTWKPQRWRNLLWWTNTGVAELCRCWAGTQVSSGNYCWGDCSFYLHKSSCGCSTTPQALCCCQSHLPNRLVQHIDLALRVLKQEWDCGAHCPQQCRTWHTKVNLTQVIQGHNYN